MLNKIKFWGKTDICLLRVPADAAVRDLPGVSHWAVSTKLYKNDGRSSPAFH